MPINNELMQDIKSFAESYYLENGISPSVREIAYELGVGKSTVQRYLERLRDSGEIEYSGERSIRTEVTDKYNDKSVSVGLVGSISCGALTFAEQNITDYFKLPYSMVGSGEFFMLRASGDSMIDAGIAKINPITTYTTNAGELDTTAINENIINISMLNTFVFDRTYSPVFLLCQ